MESTSQQLFFSLFSPSVLLALDRLFLKVEIKKKLLSVSAYGLALIFTLSFFLALSQDSCV